MNIPSKVKNLFLALSFLYINNSFSQGKILDFDGSGFSSFSFSNNLKETSLPVPYSPSYENEDSSQTQRGSCEFQVYFIDVGQGDAEFIRLPNCKTVLIDGGPSASSSSKLSKFLTEHKITSLDYVVLTHPHTDHFRGLQYVFDNLSVSNFYDTRIDNPESSTLQKFRQTVLSEPGINIFYPFEGEEFQWDSQVKVKVLHSCPNYSQSSQGEILNNCSIVMKISYQNVSLLFMGDAQGETESYIADKYGSQLRSDVLKVGHHGSPTSSSEKFLSYVSPKLAYVEVGKNSYGHPSDATLSRIESFGARVFRSDRDGTSLFIPGDKIFYCQYPQTSENGR
ncbi:MAG: MBL fold metallo-hydrolase [Elusimicrobia bacterium]|nr:MBL fold metallo-hydrolase [Elusimicrobiota bacterium]